MVIINHFKMASWQILAVLLVTVVAQVSARSRVIGGSEVDILTYPSLVQVERDIAGYFWTYNCAANVLNSIYTLSAAHCFAGNGYSAETTRIRAGTSTRGFGGMVVNIIQAFNHPSYGENANDGDITVVRLASSLFLGPTIAQATIMPPGFVIPGGWPVTYVGWGRVDPDDADFASELQAVSTVVVDNALCRENYNTLNSQPPVTENMICAGNVVSGDQDACAGDAGGGLIYNNILSGVISWGNGCGLAKFPGVSTQVSSYTDWIVATASQL